MCVFGTAALCRALTGDSSVLPPGLRASHQLLVPSPSSAPARLALGLYVVVSAYSGLFWFYMELYFHSHLPVAAKSTSIGSGFLSGC